MSESIHDILATKLGVDRDKASALLSDYIDSFKKDLRSSGRIVVDGLGTFVIDDDGLSFEPHTSLQEAVNFRYGRLEVLHATPPVTAEEEPVVPDESEPDEATATEPDAIDDSETAAEVVEIDFVEILDEAESTKPEPARSDVAETVDADSVVIETVDADSSVAKTVDADSDVAETVDADSPTRNEATIVKDRPAITGKERVPGKQDRSLARTLGIVIPLVLVVSVIVFTLVRSTGDEPDTQALTEQDETSPVLESTQMTGGVDDLDEDASVGIEKNQAAPGDQPPPQEEDPLTSVPEETEGVTSGLTRMSDGYTMIVGSTFSIEAAVQELSRYTEMGFVTGVLTYDDEGVSRLRMAVGQFETIEEADSMRIALSDQLPEGTWIRRIR
ncbi:MAG: hypothetical protein IIA50_01015 [Bacteroidetes bacterium]|nr:hypothetical protein [Bacteroidota bacterium]